MTIIELQATEMEKRRCTIVKRFEEYFHYGMPVKCYGSILSACTQNAYALCMETKTATVSLRDVERIRAA